ncbi:MAG: hypothetical protein LBK95_07610 [Bifidobacteriaceae bacterium]|jgi:plasmid stability protein|nr:hypothetical protein [Bifidobacteriaceae bacterium]
MATLQIKNFPDDLHAILRQRAKAQGVTISQYVIEVLRRALTRPTTDEWLARHDRPRSSAGSRDFDSAALIREIRDEFDPGPDFLRE